MTRTLESAIARGVTIPLFSGACRKLFGPVDHDQLSYDLNQQLREMAELDKRRWNFSFETDEPLPGKYQWETIPSDLSASSYQESTCETDVDTVTEQRHVQKSSLEDEKSKACLAETNRENCSSVSNTLKFSCELTPVRRKRTHAQTRAPQDNARITGKPGPKSNIKNIYYFVIAG